MLPAAASGAAPHAGGRDGSWAMAWLLAALAGWVDAAGLAGSTGVFLSFMSGNTVELGAALSRQEWSRGGMFGLTLGLFVAGVVAGELLASLAGRRGSSLVLGVEALCLAAGAALRLPEIMPGVGWHLIGELNNAPLVLAMGLQNAALHRVDGNSVGLTYVTGTLVQVGRTVVAWLRGATGPRVGWGYLGMWLSLAAGAGLGAGALTVSTPGALWTAAAAAGVLAVMRALVPARPVAGQLAGCRGQSV